MTNNFAAFDLPRLTFRKRVIVLFVILGFYELWNCWSMAVSGWAIITGGGNANMPPFYGLPVDMSPGQFSVNFWGFLAGWGLLGAALNPLAWMNRRRLALGSTAAAMMVGRLAGDPLTVVAALTHINGFVLFIFGAPVLAVVGLAIATALMFAIMAVLAIVFAVPFSLVHMIQYLERMFQIADVENGWLASYVRHFVYWLNNRQAPAIDESKGARFATIDEIAALHAPNDPRAMVFGHIGNPLYLSTEKHVLVMASTRSGKGVTLIIPHLLRYAGSVFVLDPKGENAKATGRTRAAINGKVHYLDPFGVTGRTPSRFNPLSRFTKTNMEAESKALAAALFVFDPNTKRDHWEASGQQLLAALILYVYLSPAIPTGKKDLPTVRRLLLGGIKGALKEMLEMTEAEGLLSDLASSFLETPEKELGSIISSAQRQTEILDNPFIAASLAGEGAGEEVDFKDWHRGTMTVFLSLSAVKFPTFNRWLRLVLTAALDEMTDTLSPPPLPVCFMLDELATLGHLPAIENAVGLAAGYGIQLVSIFQDVGQMRDLYKGRWASFIGNAGVRAVFNLDDYDSAEYWSKFAGGSIVATRSFKEDRYGISDGSANVGEQHRPLLSTEELMMRYASGKMLILATGAHPIETDRVSYWNDRRLDGLWDDPRPPHHAAAGRNVPPQGPRSSGSTPPPPPPRPDPASPSFWAAAGGKTTTMDVTELAQFGHVKEKVKIRMKNDRDA